MQKGCIVYECVWLVFPSIDDKNKIVSRRVQGANSDTLTHTHVAARSNKVLCSVPIDSILLFVFSRAMVH